MSKKEAIQELKARRQAGEAVKLYKRTQHLMVTRIGRGDLVPYTSVTYFVK